MGVCSVNLFQLWVEVGKRVKGSLGLLGLVLSPGQYLESGVLSLVVTSTGGGGLEQVGSKELLFAAGTSGEVDIPGWGQKRLGWDGFMCGKSEIWL